MEHDAVNSDIERLDEIPDEANEVTHDSPEERRLFAKSQRKFLIDNGIKSNEQIVRIFKITGPGQIQEAFKLATCHDWSTDEGQDKKDILFVCLIGYLNSRIGWDRMSGVLENCGFHVPEAYNHKCFRRVLRGAQEILVPNSVRLTPEEERDVQDTLNKYGSKNEE